MPSEYEIILKRCSPGVFIGILMLNGVERYQTKDKSSAVAALTDVQFWMQMNI